MMNIRDTAKSMWVQKYDKINVNKGINTTVGDVVQAKATKCNALDSTSVDNNFTITKPHIRIIESEQSNGN